MSIAMSSDAETHVEEPQAAAPGLSRADFMMLTKFRLSTLVIVTTFFGFWLASRGGVNGMLLLHTVVGATLAAFAAGIFNQLMEIEPDAKMKRTASRPLPGRRVDPVVAFGLGWVLSAFSIIHLAKMVNLESSALAAATLLVYLFIYTPMKQRSSWNTVVGAVAGALPPLIGWTGAAGAPHAGEPSFRFALMVEPGAIYLFLLLFVWQMPHFLAINWMYRDEYRKGGFVMWANDDDSGAKTSMLCVVFSVMALLVALMPVVFGLTGSWFLIPAVLLNGLLLAKAWRFYMLRDRPTARKLFLFTLLHLPLMLGLTLLFWRHGA